MCKKPNVNFSLNMGIINTYFDPWREITGYTPVNLDAVLCTRTKGGDKLGDNLVDRVWFDPNPARNNTTIAIVNPLNKLKNL